MRVTKTYLYLLLILVLAVILRVIAAQNTHVSTDEMVYSIIPWNIIDAGRLGTVEQSPLFFYLTDLGYKIRGGITPISIRSTAIIFGGMATIVIYLISGELFRKRKAALFSAFLFAVSGFSLINNYEMDTAAFFFGLLSLFFFIRFKEGQRYNLYLATINLALSTLMKPMTAIFAAASILVYFIYGWKQKLFFDRKEQKVFLNKQLLKTMAKAFLLGIIIISPVLIYNYFIYQEKGITDAYFSLFLGVGKTVHQGMEGKPWEFSRFLNVTSSFFQELLVKDTFILILGLLGLFLSFKMNKYGNSILLLSTLLFFTYIAGQSGGATHFLWLPLVLSIYAGYTLDLINSRLVKQFNFKYFAALILLVAVLLSFFHLQDLKENREQSLTLLLRDYAHQEIPDNAVVVIDPRIYRGIHAWVFNDKHYLDGTYFGELVSQMEQIPGEMTEVPLYYLECGPGKYCGWKPEDFQRINAAGEKISDHFRDLPIVKEIKTADTIIIYRTTVDLPSGVFEVIDRTHQFWFYPVGWKYTDNLIDDYQAKGLFNLLNWFGFLVLWIDVLLALLTIPFLLWWGWKKSFSP